MYTMSTYLCAHVCAHTHTHTHTHTYIQKSPETLIWNTDPWGAHPSVCTSGFCLLHSWQKDSGKPLQQVPKV